MSACSIHSLDCLGCGPLSLSVVMIRGGVLPPTGYAINTYPVRALRNSGHHLIWLSHFTEEETEALKEEGICSSLPVSVNEPNKVKQKIDEIEKSTVIQPSPFHSYLKSVEGGKKKG